MFGPQMKPQEIRPDVLPRDAVRDRVNIMSGHSDMRKLTKEQTLQVMWLHWQGCWSGSLQPLIPYFRGHSHASHALCGAGATARHAAGREEARGAWQVFGADGEGFEAMCLDFGTLGASFSSEPYVGISSLIMALMAGTHDGVLAAAAQSPEKETGVITIIAYDYRLSLCYTSCPRISIRSDMSR